MKNIKFVHILLILIFPSIVHGNLVDLENDMKQNFVLESKKIEIAGFPYAFNPSIVEWRGGILMCFRAGKHFQFDKDSSEEDPSGEEASGESPSEETPSEEPPSDYCCDFTQEDLSNEKNKKIKKAHISTFNPSFDLFTAHYEDTPSEDPSQDVKEKNKKDPSRYSPNRFGLVWLDKDLNPIGKTQLLEIPFQTTSYRQQDPRLVVVGGKLMIVYSDMVAAETMPLTRRMFVGELQYQNKLFTLKNTESLTTFKGERETRWEKNWVPFDYKGNLLLAYQINPHIILYPQLGQSSCETVSSSQGNISWNWGELRGGTPALRLNKTEYLAFFHSSKNMGTVQSQGVEMQHYFMGAYVFSSAPPFAINKISPEPIIGENYYNGRPYQTWKPLRVVFPCGFIMNEKYIWISYGRQDHEIWITKLDKQKLLNSLTPVSML